MNRTGLKALAAAACVAAVLVLNGCPNDVTLDVNVAPEGAGTVALEPEQATYTAGTVVQLTAQPVLGWRFNRWAGLVANPALASTTVTLDHSEKIVAVFEPILQSGPRLNAQAAPSSDLANITVDPLPDPDSGFYRSGQIVKLNADTSCCPGGGEFVRWEGNVSNANEPETTVVMNGDQTVRAVIRPENAPDYEVNVTALPEGAGTVKVTPNQNVFFAGEEVTIEAVPGPGYNFAFWIGDVANIISAATTFAATKDATIIAFFKPLSGIPDEPHAYLFGIPEGPLADQVEQRFPNVTAIGTQARGLVMPGAAVDIIEDNQGDRDALNGLFAAGFPIVLTQATALQIAGLEQILGLDLADIALEAGEEYLAYFGVDLEPDGKVWRLAGHMPRAGDTEQLPDELDEWRIQCISTLEGWILRDNHRAQDFPGVDVAAETALKQTYESLTQLAKADPLQVYYFYSYSDTQKSDSFALTTFPYSVHSLTGSGMDYFYIAQYGTFSGSGSYKYTEYDVINEAVRYLYQYRMWTQVTGFDAANADITIYGATPASYSGADPVATSSVTWSLGGSVGINTATGPTFNITSGVQVSNSYTISIPDVSILSELGGFNQPQWKYNIRRAYETDQKELRVPPLIAQGTFAPINQWLFVVKPTVRNTYPAGLPLTIGLEADQSNDQLSCYFGPVNGQLYCSFHQNTSKVMTATQSFTVPWPPAAP